MSLCNGDSQHRLDSNIFCLYQVTKLVTKKYFKNWSPKCILGLLRILSATARVVASDADFLHGSKNTIICKNRLYSQPK